MGVGEEGTGSYPREWEADVVVADGGTVHLRPVVPEDVGALEAMYARTSESSRYMRFFSPRPVLSERELYRFTHVDYVDRVALVVLLGDDLIAVARYDRESGSSGTAEVAFLVEDAHQGRGLGTVLLEHVAAAGRERGITTFVADVLAENHRMVRVFLDAGYQASRSYEGSVARLEFPIAQTDTSLAVAHERAQRAEARSLERILTPRTVAVVGASSDPGKVGHVVLRNLLTYRPAAAVYPVHPTARSVLGVPAYASVEELPVDVDLAVLAVPADAVVEVARQCGRKQVRGLVVVSSGFGERDEAGGNAERELVRVARRHGMRVVGPNALGLVNTDPAVRLNATLATDPPAPGRLGFFCQSGALGTAILTDARSRGLGVSTFVSAGNRADVSGNDLLQYWTTDPHTDVVLLYLESFGNPRRFARLARRLARDKPVVAVKGGRYGVKPALAGRAADLTDQSVQALFEASGVIRVDTLAQMFDVAQLLAYQPLPGGSRVGVVGNSSALGVLVTDACVAAGLEPASMVDIGPEGSPERFADALRDAVASEDVDAVVAVFVPPLATANARYARAIAAAAKDSDKPVVSTFLGAEGVPRAMRQLGDNGEVQRGSVPSYPSPERAVLALSRAWQYARWLGRPAGRLPELDDIDPEAARRVVATALEEVPEGRSLGDAELRELLAAYAIGPLADRDAAGGGPADAVACEVGVVDDPSFGALVSFGIAGVATELLGDRAYRALPLTDRQAAELVRAPRAYPLLAGHRGAEPVDTGALEDLLLRVARLADDVPELLELRLAPVLAAPTGLAVAAASARVGPATARVAPGPRRLAPAS
ncbi:MAG: GNAT family N-acetyltransferase [Streptosporangiales bacterium]